ncbi:MAG: radical SAM protein, partial [Clostridia bacterium]|nr:radical SAM protein [Clostridia bacterium]
MESRLLADYTLEELEVLLADMSQPKFRAKQLFEWLNKGASFDGMKNIPKTFLDSLSASGYYPQGIEIVKALKSSLDGTVKYLYKLSDGNIIEGVLMKYKYGNTLCVSTQVGCRMNCAFCASGLEGLIRNLSAGEILGQVVAVNRENAVDKVRGVTNIVLMGSGEPLDNYDNVCKLLTMLSDERCLN